MGILAIYRETGSEMRKLKQTCSTRVFGLQYVFYGMSVDGGVSEIRLPVFVTFFTNVVLALCFQCNRIGLTIRRSCTYCMGSVMRDGMV